MPPASRLPPPASSVAIIGGGIVGLATAMALRNRAAKGLIVLEAESDVATHQTGHNSGVIHSGLYYKPGSQKALNCAAGREAMYRFCAEENIPHERCGKIVVATRQDELPKLEELRTRGLANGLAGMEQLGPEAIREREPHAAGIAGLWVPQTGIVDYVAVAQAMRRLVAQAGAEVRTDCRLGGVTRDGAELVLATSGGEFRCRNLVNCAGLQSDRVARMCGLNPQLRIVPFRGEYYTLRPTAAALVRNLIYPVPDPRFPFLGVHLTRMIRGGVEAGPNAVLALARHGYRKGRVNVRDLLDTFTYSGFWRMAMKFPRAGIGEMYRSYVKRAFAKELARLMPELTAGDLQPGGAGVRAQAVLPDGRLVDDFCIERADRMVHVLNAPSPAATASLAIGESIAEMAAKQFEL
ncbi:MAG: L-2-hydroxyglutarate oxidase [Planctomycetia bacterium]|nr:L-2-hydroxyglutarate oxidase [Planctomycetia bacterium]